MSNRFGPGNRRDRQKGPPGRKGNGGGGRRNGPGEPPRSSPRLPPVWGRHEVEKLFDGAMPRKPSIPNPGLVFDRYLKIWATDTSLLTERFDALQQFVEEYGRLQQDYTPLLQAVHGRLERITAEGSGQALRVAPRGRFVSGLGTSHPLENGFCFDYTLGVPYLPGSSVKGLCRRMAELERDVQTVLDLFGEESEDDESATEGDIIALPAYPEKWPKLEVDVVNCHYQQYYASDPIVLEERAKGDKVVRVGPHEIEDPVPVFFLTVRGRPEDTCFVFRLASRSNNHSNVREAMALLKHGLNELGIGAKRALGYGLMDALQ